MPISVKVAVANTGAVTIAVNALTPVALTKRGGTALVSGDLAAGQIIQVAWDGTQYQLVGHEPQELTNVATVGGHTAHQLAPPGTVVAYAAPTVPAGWLACNGQLVSRESYADLFAAIGTTYGAGDNVSTFQLPDLRGEFVRGWDNGRGVDVDRAIGSTQADSLKSHTHTMAAIPNSALPAGVSDGVMTGGITTMNTGATGGSETRPRNVALFYVIKY
jgi:microcystin-dependent protein